MATEREILLRIKSILDGKGFEETKKHGSDLNNIFGGLADTFKGLLPALTAVALVAAMKKMSDSATAYAESVNKVANITGVSAEQASKWVIEAQHLGTSADTVANGMAILSRNLVNGSKEFERFGVNTKDVHGNLLPLDDIIKEVRDREKELGEGANATAMEMALFGKSGKELHEFLSADNKEMDKTVATARDLGLILNNVTNEQIEQTNRKLNDFKMIQESLGKELNEQLFPYLLKFESILLDVVHNLGALRDGARIAWAALKEGAVGATKEMINQQVAATKKSQDESDLRLLAEMVASKKSGKLKTEDFHQQLTYFMETTNANQAAIDKILFAEDGLQKKKKEQLHIATNDEIKAADDRVKANKKELEEKSRRVLIYWESAA
jgi:hypothetical protein